MSALGLDPAPGDPAAAARAAAVLRDVATELAAAQRRLVGEAVPAGWSGAAASAFRATVEEVLPALGQAAEAHTDAAAALGRWGRLLADRQAEARRLEAAAERAAADAELARSRHAWALREAASFGAVLLSPEQLALVQLRAEGAALAVDVAHEELVRLQQRARALREEHDDDAQRLAREVSALAEAAPDRPWLGRRVVGAVVDEARDHAEVLGELSDVAGEVGGVVALGALAAGAVAGAPVVAVLGGAALASTGVALGGHALARAAGADVGTDVLALDALGVATGAVGAAAGRVAGSVLDAVLPRAGTAGLVADRAGGVGTGFGLVRGADDAQEDRSFAHFLPDDGLEAGALLAGGLAGTAALSAVRHGRHKDRRRTCGG